jgi:uncharacterized membrane protein YgaE (UPF0421/DUF939 family)
LVAVLAAYAIVQQLPIVYKDLISVLFGLMMTLEPVTVTGIRSGLKQITATLLGAMVTAICILIFGINIWTVAFSVSATLFICLKINWREVSPVAIFTSIYMTNYVQFTANGEPSVVLTFQLRILSLGIGVLIAIIFNFIFSLFFYRQMERKRIVHILIDLTGHLKGIKNGIEGCSIEPICQVKDRLPDTFKGIDWLTSLLKDKDKEAKFKKKMRLGFEKASYHKVLTALRNITHLIYDTAYFLTLQMNALNRQQLQAITARLEEFIKESDYLAACFGKDVIKYSVQVQENQIVSQSYRIEDNLKGIKEMLDLINETLL